MRPPFLLLSGLLVLCGCGDNRQAEVYTIASEKPPEIQPAPTPSQSMASQRLPDEVVNTGGPTPSWTVPASWTEQGGSPMRRGSFGADGSAGSVDIAITSFPGDVGGLLANVNRWRQQIGIAPIADSELETSVERLQINGREAIYTELEGSSQATLAAIFEHDGQSWFIKMTGPVASVSEQEEAFRQFINSIRFPDAEGY